MPAISTIPTAPAPPITWPKTRPTPSNLPDTIYFSDGTTAAVNIATNATCHARSAPAAHLTYQVTANVTSGWDYIQLPDPGAGYTLYKVVRSDGTVIPVSDQAWQTDVTVSPTRRIDGRLRAAHPRRQQHRLVHGVLSTDHSTAPTVASVSSVSSPQSGPIGSVDVTFSEPIDPSTFTTRT